MTYKSRFKCNIGMPTNTVGKRCKNVEQGNIARTKNPVFRNPDFSGILIASQPGQKVLLPKKERPRKMLSYLIFCRSFISFLS